ncbi:MAG TPA: GFA family protein [Kofleriaceae bacterium]|nr:GFA family protein [Kofleriaceae bacterium]
MTHCHCSRCRKVRGTANATNLLVALPGIRFVRGEELLSSYKPPDARTFTHVFCRMCGSSMPRLDENRGIAIVPMGAFDDDPGARPERHIFVDSRASWDEISDDELPRFPGPPPAL